MSTTNLASSRELFEKLYRQGRGIHASSNKASNAVAFNFRENWELVEPHLKNKRVLNALDTGMRELAALLGRQWDSKDSPWSWTSIDDCWEGLADQCVHEAGFKYRNFEEGYPNRPTQAELHREKKFREQFFPRPETYQWYQAMDRAHWLAPWCAELGRCVYRRLHWNVLRGEHHSTAYGHMGDGQPLIIFDILYFETMTGDEILRLVREGKNDSRALVWGVSPIPKDFSAQGGSNGYA